MSWYFKDAGGTERGPVEEVVLKAYVIQGRITVSSPVRSEGSHEWAAAGETCLAQLFARRLGAQEPFTWDDVDPVTVLLLTPDGGIANYCLGPAPLVIGSAAR